MRQYSGTPGVKLNFRVYPGQSGRVGRSEAFFLPYNPLDPLLTLHPTSHLLHLAAQSVSIHRAPALSEHPVLVPLHSIHEH